ncbi:MAG: hypothetical protein IBX68_08670, partial [Dehalococcoidia bacterium]|nr:hypothetical protein [Dehalococcoidia bacterium]
MKGKKNKRSGMLLAFAVIIALVVFMVGGSTALMQNDHVGNSSVQEIAPAD